METVETWALSCHRPGRRDRRGRDGHGRRQAARIPSLALQFGRTAALRVSAAIFTLIFFLTLVPLIQGSMGIRYLLAILVTNTGLVFFTVKLLRSRDSKEGVFAMRGIYLGFLAGMLVYILGHFLL